MNWMSMLRRCSVLLIFCGCPQAVAVIGPGVDFAVCVIGEYEREPAGTPIATVIADEIATCGGDALSIVRVLDAHEPASMHAAVAHEAAQ